MSTVRRGDDDTVTMPPGDIVSVEREASNASSMTHLRNIVDGVSLS